MTTKTIKRAIDTATKTQKTTTKKATSKRTVSNTNVFALDEKKMTLTLTLPVEWNGTHTTLKAKHITDVEGEKYKKLSFLDKAGNEIYIFKTGFGYEPVVKTKKITENSLDTSKLSDDEQKVLELLLKKMSK